MDSAADEICNYFEQLNTLEGVEPKKEDMYEAFKAGNAKKAPDNKSPNTPKKQKKFCQCCLMNNPELFRNYDAKECCYLKRNKNSLEGERGDPRYRETQKTKWT